MALTGWNADKKIKLTIPAQSSALTNFPVLVKLSGTSGTGSFDCAAVFTELGANSKKIAVEVGGTGNQCYVEIERWDNTNSLAWLWVKVPSISATAATVLYFYYDSAHADNTTYVGDIGSTPGQNVWDSNFVFVCHQAQDPSGTAPQIKDSTSNAQHGTSYGSMTSGDLVDGLIGKGLDYEGTDDYTQHGTSIALNGMTAITLEVCCDLSAWLAYGGIVGKNQGASNYEGYLLDQGVSNGDFRFFVGHDGTGSPTTVVFNDTTLAQHYFTCTANATQAVIWDGDTKGTPVSTGSNHSLNGGTANLTIGEQSFLTGYYATGWIDEIRISDIVRSDDWITATNLSNTDALIAFSPLFTTVISALDQLYDLARDQVLAALDQQYSLSAEISTALVQTWGLVLETALNQYYEDAEVVSRALNQYYGDAYPVLTGLDQRWGDTVELTTALVQQYNLMHLVEQGLTQEWAICGTPVDTGLTQAWDLRQRNEVMAALSQYYNLMRDGSEVQAPAFYVMADGVLLRPSSFSWTISEDSAAIEATITLPDKSQWNSVQLRGALEIYWQGRLHEFFVEAKPRTRSIDSSKKFKADYLLVGQSLTAGLEAPYAMPITREYPATVMASTIVADLADGFTIDWQIDDFPVIGGTFFVNSETPLTAIKKLIGDDTVKAIVQTSHDGKLIVRRDFPVSPGDWPTTAPDHVVSDDGGVFSDSDDMDIMPGYNMIEISSELTADTGKRLMETVISATQKEVRGISVPWEDDFPLETSGGSWVVIEQGGIIIERIEDELVEIVDGIGSTQYPVYSQVSAVWLQTQLGTITAAEDGSLVTELQGNSLAKISYETKYRKWIVHDPQVESVQVYIPEEVAA